MCSATVCDHPKPGEKVDLPQMRSGTRVGAKVKRPPFETPTSEPASPLLTPKAKIKDENEDEDIFAGLSLLFDGFQLDDSDDSDDSDNDSDTESEEAPRSPASKGIDPGSAIPHSRERTYFYAFGRLYFHDAERNVYIDNSPGEVTLAHAGKPFTLEGNAMFTPDFYIGGAPYYFDAITGQLLYEEQGTLRTVYTWEGESVQSLDDAFSPTFSPPATASETFQSNNSMTFEIGFSNYEEAKRPPPWSPGSSTLSPIISSGSRASSVGYEPLIPQGYNMITVWQEQTKHIQTERLPVQSNKGDRRVCPECHRKFRRPSSLEDHLNVHSGKKPHMCPFENCKTGFATKSNMKRHFQTHRANITVEEYSGGKVARTKSNSRTTTYNSKAFHTQRFRLAT